VVVKRPAASDPGRRDEDGDEDDGMLEAVVGL
jgi:hypothetical protein